MEDTQVKTSADAYKIFTQEDPSEDDIKRLQRLCGELTYLNLENLVQRFDKESGVDNDGRGRSKKPWPLHSRRLLLEATFNHPDSISALLGVEEYEKALLPPEEGGWRSLATDSDISIPAGAPLATDRAFQDTSHPGFIWKDSEMVTEDIWILMGASNKPHDGEAPPGWRVSDRSSVLYARVRTPFFNEPPEKDSKNANIISVVEATLEWKSDHWELVDWGTPKRWKKETEGIGFLKYLLIQDPKDVGLSSGSPHFAERLPHLIRRMFSDYIRRKEHVVRHGRST